MRREAPASRHHLPSGWVPHGSTEGRLMRLRTVATVCRKEILDVVRDRRTLTFMLVVPTVAIPLLMWITTALMLHATEKLQREWVRVQVLNPEAAPDLVRRLQERADASGEARQVQELLRRRGLLPSNLSLLRSDDPAAFRRFLARRNVDPAALQRELRALLREDDFELDPSTLLARAYPPRLELLTDRATDPGRSSPEPTMERHNAPGRAAALVTAIKEERFAAALHLDDDAAAKLAAGETATARIYYVPTADRSRLARDSLSRLLRQVGARMVRERLAARGLPRGLATPVRARPRRLPGPGLVVRLMSQILPYFIILFAFLGALYPAIDLGAGEKERGTLETLLVAPVSRLALVVGKFIVVAVASVISAVLATLSLAASLSLGVLAPLEEMGGGLSFRAGDVLVALLLVLPIAALFAALLLAISFFAKSFKEAQSYASPLTIVIILPAFVSFLPGVKLDWLMASLPLVNVSLALREILTGNLNQHLGQVGLIFVSMSLVAAALLWLTAWWARREAVLFRT